MTFLYLLAFVQVVLNEPNYKATYKLTHCADSTNLEQKSSEYFSLILTDGRSVYASESFLKRNSVSILVKNGLLSEGELMANSRNRFTTKFPQFISKAYSDNTVRVFETIGLIPYKYYVKEKMDWTITQDKSIISGYTCTKAITNYAGRQYEAWFTSEVPIPDGPYLFRGLPGLIIKINDTRNHYTFTMVSLKKTGDQVIEVPTYRKQQPIEIEQTKAFILREECRKDPIGCITRATGSSPTDLLFTPNGSSQSVPAASYANRKRDNNPLELR
ncbi:GLPGLI family protein [Fibrella forsythiae]|uniref:GLPGLI family protein n=1 Tax=Fibrella forsythiae TaxID=2817061 RepID=A0ABS3JFL5_9BACT|nr:GLPGLI family protein [Fibrella forsythiae]MBO0948790.1 GLPGLI family protein [Fibrella forsythiae]